MITEKEIRNTFNIIGLFMICVIGCLFILEVYIPTKPELERKTLLVPSSSANLVVSDSEYYLYVDVPNYIHLENVESFNIHLKTNSGLFLYEERPILSRWINNTVYVLLYPSGGEITGVSIHYTEQPKE